ncbi:hypothetical protein C7271_07180 [filamentous cyanobacterium CCP5]|nr:hypothetical protein C7271_07180 [filamentous cyanobacterium CCP5]
MDTQLDTANDRLDNAQIWQGLKQAIANSSGFQRWKVENHQEKITDDQLVQRYLRETLETLAY